jgi:phosphatidylglycerophosphate synthase
MSLPSVDAIVLADSPHGGEVLLGLTLVERGRRVVTRLGAQRVQVIDGPEAAAGLEAWRAARPGAALVILRAGDQLVHLPLVEPLLGGTAERRIAIGPEGAYAGALWASPAAAPEAIAVISANPKTGDAELAARWTDAERIPHGRIARHPATTPAERRAAERLLLRILVKDEDSPITRYLTRPLTRPLTQLLVNTPITANQVTYSAGLLGLIGCWFTALPGKQNLILGAALVLLASLVDDCDGGLSRLRLTSSRFGAWLDTIVDEMTTIVYLAAIGYHTYLRHPELPWIGPSIAVGLACYAASLYGIYYFLIVVSKSANSQHYIGDLEIIESASGVGLRARRRTSSAPPWLRKLGGVLVLAVRRDFITLLSFAAALVDGYFAIYLMMLAGGVIAALVVVPEHLRLRRQLREVARRGATPRLI